MYHSWWFRLLILLLTINIVVCSIDRLSATWKIVFVKNPKFKLERFRKLPNREDFTDERSVEALKETYEKYVSRHFGYRRTEVTDNGFCIFSEKWRWTRLGVYGVHLSVILLLIGGLIGSIFGFDGYVNIPEGESVKQIQTRNTGEIKMLDFEIRCEDFDVSFYDSGQPKEYRSSLTILEQGKPVMKKNIIVNDPLRYKGINLFQSSYGTLPSNEIVLNFASTATGMVYEKKASIGEQIDIPEAMGKFVLMDYSSSSMFRGHKIGEAFKGRLTPAEGKSVEILLPLRFPSFDKMRKGDVFISVANHVPRYYTGLQVTKDPGVWVVYSGFILMIIGCYITFFMSHQRLCIEVAKKGGKCRVMISGRANRNKLSMNTKVKKIKEKLIKL
jgi:cytochrome c biogenesis protein